MIVDAHVHLWSLERAECGWPTEVEAAIHKDFTVDDLKSKMRCGVDAAILVQSQEHEDDTSWLLEIAADEPAIAGVVGWCDLHAHDAARRVAEVAAKKKMIGIRPMVQDQSSEWYDDASLRPAFKAISEAGLVMDALVRVRHLPALQRLASRYPDLPIVIDHAAKPAMTDDSGFELWRAAIAPLADKASVTCKMSGLLTERGDQPPEAIVPFIIELIRLFGPERVMWGSDWPVLNMAGEYSHWLRLAQSVVPAADQDQVFAYTACRTYRIPSESLQ